MTVLTKVLVQRKSNSKSRIEKAQFPTPNQIKIKMFLEYQTKS